MTKQTEILVDIRERIVRIETHLADMNGKLLKHDTFVYDSFPCYQKELDTRIDKLNKDITIVAVKVAFVIGVAAAICGAILTFLINNFFT